MRIIETELNTLSSKGINTKIMFSKVTDLHGQIRDVIDANRWLYLSKMQQSFIIF